MARKTLPELIDSLIGARTGGELGPKEAALEARLDHDRAAGLADASISWGPHAARMTREERAAAVIEFLDAPRRPAEFPPRSRRPQADLAKLGRGEIGIDDIVGDLLATA